MRRYDSRLRRDQARQTREAILGTAREMFLANGYHATSVAAIAEATGVAVDTVYKAYGNKAGLVRAIAEQALAGDGPVPAEERSDDLQATESDPRAVIAGWATLTSEVAPRIAPVLLLIRAAATTDADMARLREDLDNDRLRRMEHNANYLGTGGHLRPGLTVTQARDIMWAYTDPGIYEALVQRRAWNAAEFGQFVGHALTAALLPGRPD